MVTKLGEREGPYLVLQVDVAPQASLAHVVARAFATIPLFQLLSSFRMVNLTCTLHQLFENTHYKECLLIGTDAGASEAILARYFAAAILVVLIRAPCYVWLGGERFSDAPQKALSDEDEAPETEPASRPRHFACRVRCICRCPLVLGVFEASRLAHMRMTIAVAEPHVDSKVEAPPPRILA